MEKLPAGLGWIWIKEGFALFRKRPAEMSTLFLSYMFLMLGVGIIPFLGQILPLILVPVFSMGFMQACVQLEQDKRIHPNLLLTGVRSPAFHRLMLLGVLYLLAAVIAVASSGLIDGGVFWSAMSGQIALDGQTMRDSNMSMAMIFAAAVYTPMAMALWYAAPLVMWQDMGVGKAIFYSFFAVRRAGRAFLVYGLIWVVIGVLLPAIISAVIAMIVNVAAVTLMILLPLSVIMTVIMYCSFYPTYVHVFGKPPLSLEK
jgi:hypothetical protein